MTLEDFQKFCEVQAQKEAKKQEEKRAKLQRELAAQRFKGRETDFIMEERGYWLVVKNNMIVDICDSKGKAWRSLHED